MGNDYYETNERILQHGCGEYDGEVFGWYLVTHEYYLRYRKPVMHTETNQKSQDAVVWLWRQWQNLLYMRERGIPVLGFTWYSLIDQVDWDTELREANNRVNPFGLYDMNRKIRPVGEAYKQIIEEYDEISVVPRSGILSVT
jgi:beta-glucosidase/6-phospho-beta-glucosidase/beta-galactosidase